MGYTVVKSFERGLDTRRMIDNIEAGGLLDAKDCHITRGGEVEKRAAFVVTATLPATTFGLYVTQDKVFHTWGTATSAPVGMPAGAVYHSIPDPVGGGALDQILSVEEFSGKLYVIARYASGSVRHWYDDNLLTEYEDPEDAGDPDPPGGGVSGAKPFAKFTYTAILIPGATEGGITEPPGPDESFITRAWLLKPGTTYTFSGPTPDAFPIISHNSVDGLGRPIISPPMSFGNSYGETVASAIAALINAYATATPVEVIASNASGVLQVIVDAEGTTYNGWSIYISTTNISQAPGTTVALAGGALPIPGEPPPPDTPTIRPLNLGTFALAHNEKMYVVNQSLLNISAITDCTHWDAVFFPPGAGQIDMSMVAEGTPTLLAMADYQGDLALFGLKHILIWHMDPDAELNFKRQVLHRTGLCAPHALVAYSEGDVMYLSLSGIRSLRVRSGVDEAFAADIGTLIDDLVRAKVEAATFDFRQRHFWAEVEPRHGRLWMALHDTIYVLSYFPESRISAWTIYDASAHPVDMMNAADDRVYWRSGNDIIVYSGEGGTTYDATEAVARLPYIDGGKLATSKNWSAIDAAVVGTWQIRASFDPTQPTAFDLIANITKSTYAQQKLAMNGESPSVSLELRTTYVGPAKIGNATLHYTDSTAD
jgi:hypothetical protein